MALEVAEIVRKVRRIQIVANRQVDDLLAGAYRSVFTGFRPARSLPSLDRYQ